MPREVREGQTEGGLPYLSFGEGPPLEMTFWWAFPLCP